MTVTSTCQTWWNLANASVEAYGAGIEVPLCISVGIATRVVVDPTGAASSSSPDAAICSNFVRTDVSGTGRRAAIGMSL